MVLTVDVGSMANPEASMQIENQSLVGDFSADGSVRFRFSPKSLQIWSYKIQSNIPALDGKTGGMTSCRRPKPRSDRPRSILTGGRTILRRSSRKASTLVPGR